MKKILFLLLLTVASYGQTYQNPTFGTVKTMTAPTVTTTPHLGTVESNGTISKITPANLPVSTATQTAIDAKVGDFINDNATTIAPSQNAVYDALQLKQTVFTGISQSQFLTENDIVIDNTARTLTIATVKNGEAISGSNPVEFFTDGNGVSLKHTKTSPVVFSFTDTTGIWYFYFNSSGTAIASQTAPTDASTIAMVYRIYWNAALATADKRVIESIEVYKNDGSWIDREWKNTQGAQYASGLNISSNVIASGTPAVDGSNAVINLSSGTIIDNNFSYTLTNAASGTTKFTQDLGSGLLPATSGKFITITNNSSLVLDKIPATDFPFLWNSGTNTPEYLTQLGVRTAVTNNYFFVYYVYALQDPRRGETIKIKSAEIDFANATLAEAHTWAQLQNLFPTLKDSKIRLLYKLTFEYKSSYDVGTKKSALRKVDDLRKQRITTSATVGGTVPASIVTFSPSGNISSTNVQLAIEELDAEKTPNTRLINTTSPIVGGGDLSTDRTISIPAATTSVNGYLSSTDWTTFNNKAPLASPAFTGTPTAPTATAGTNTTQIATTAFVAAADAGNVKLTGNQTITGQKTFQNSSGGDAIIINNTATSGRGIRVNSVTGSVLDIFQTLRNSVETGKIDYLGNVTAPSFIKSGGLSTEYLKADGSVSTLTNPVTGTGSSGMIPVFNSSSNIIDSSIRQTSSFVEVLTKPFRYINDLGDAVGFHGDHFAAFGSGSKSDLVTYVYGSGNKYETVIDGSIISTVTGSGVSVNGSLSATTFTGGATLTGTPTAPTATAGTNTTQIATTAFVQGAARPYKVYTALITQTGTDAPTPTVLENTLGGTVVWTRTAQGKYDATLSGVFTANKVVIFSGNTTSNTVVAGFSTTVNTATIETYITTTGAASDNELASTPVEIRVYL